MNILSTRNLFAVFVLLVSTSLFGQGIMRGVVSDSLTQKPLIGANVFLLGTALGSATDLDGNYKISNIPAGNHRLRISYIGYKSKTLEVNIQSNKTLQLNINLTPDVLEGQTVVVTGQAMGQAAAINQQLSSNTIVNVVSEEKIKELPDANAAESIGRLPGVSLIRSGGEANNIILRGLSEKFTNITIDGIQIPSTDAEDRGVDLSTISQSSLSGIELYKALTSDKDGDAIAGSVNLITKKAPATRKIRLDLKGDYNNLMQSFKQYDFALNYGERFFKDILGVQVIGNLENRIRSSESIDLNYDQGLNNQTDYAINDFTLQFNNEIRTRNGLSVLLDINTPDNGSIRINNVYSGTKRDYILSTRDYPSSGGVGGTVTYSARDRIQNIKTYNSSIIGNNTLVGLSLTWGLSFAQSTSDFPYDYYVDYLEPSIIKNGVPYAGMGQTPTIKDQPEKLIPYALNNFNAATLYEAYYRAQSNLDKERTAYLNAAKHYTFGNLIAGELKVGGKYKIQDKSNLNSQLYAPYYLGYWQPYERTANGTIQPKNLNGTYFQNFFQNYQKSPNNLYLSLSDFLDSTPDSRDIFKLYNLNPIVNRDKLEQWYALNKNGVDQNGKSTEYTNDASVKANDYSITERVAAGYIMNTLNFGQDITFIAGVRVENENNDYNSRYSPIQTGGFPIPPDASRDTTANHNETIVLPNFQLNVKPTDFMNVRIAAYKALARPDFNYRLNTYFAWRPAATTSSNQLVLGNPLLKTAQAWNYEVNLSFFGNNIGLISVSAFYKDITDMYHVLNGINTSGNSLIESLGLKWKTLFNGTYSLTVPYNSPQATKVWGFEFEHQINFTFLPGFLQNFVLSYNASLVRSETHLISARTDTTVYYIPELPGIPFYKFSDRAIDIKQQLEDQPEFYGNISLGYDIAGFSGRVSLFHQSEYNLSFTPSGRGDQIVNAYTRVDLALKQRITKYLSVLLNVQNLTNIKEGTSIYDRVNGYKILNTNETYGVTADFGVILEL